METITSDIQKGIVQLSLFILYAKFFWLKLVYFYDKHIHQMKKKKRKLFSLPKAFMEIPLIWF